MSERKVLSKYYPPDFDPSKLTRTPKHLRPTGPKTISVRLMAPYSMKCTSCGEYIYKGRKFNARKETTEEKYLNIQIYRFYIKCTRCSSEITFRTDPKNMDYTCEKGAKRNFEMWRDPTSKELQETDEQRLDRLEREEAEAAEEEERNAMEELEQKMEESKREMAVADALDDIRTRNARIERGEKGVKEDQALAQTRQAALDEKAKQEAEDEEQVRKAFEQRQALMALKPIPEQHDEEAAAIPSFGKTVRPRKQNTILAKPVAGTTQKPIVVANSTPLLAGYGSDDD